MFTDNNYLSLKKCSPEDRPREKMLEHGRSSLSTAEIIAILIGSGTPKKSAVELSRDILSAVDNDLDKLARLTVHDLMKFKGVGVAKAVSIIAALELGRRKERNTFKVEDQPIKSAKDIYGYVRDRFQDLDHEEFHVVLLNRANKVKSIELISKGGISGTVVDGKIIFKKALEQSASAVILCHNHPSGNTRPSRADIEVTKKIKSFGVLIDMPVLDHLIVADSGYLSMADEGLM